jgi:hypothetical protein
MTDPSRRSIAEFMPTEWRAAIAEPLPPAPRCPEAGLYFSTYVGHHRLLRLPAEGPFLLLLWVTERNGQLRETRTRAFTGTARLTRFATGDRRIDLLPDRPFGPNDNDAAQVYFVAHGDMALLIEKKSLRHSAKGIFWNGRFDRSDRYLRRVPGIDHIPDMAHVGMHAPPLAALPTALRALIPPEPLRVRITEVAPMPGPEEDDTVPIVVVVDKGAEDGLRHNMPLHSPAGAPRQLIGWCSEPEPHCCRVRMRFRRDAEGRPVVVPEVGDELSSRAPNAPPLT